jgi:hypothetical protein
MQQTLSLPGPGGHPGGLRVFSPGPDFQVPDLGYFFYIYEGMALLNHYSHSNRGK